MFKLGQLYRLNSNHGFAFQRESQLGAPYPDSISNRTAALVYYEFGDMFLYLGKHDKFSKYFRWLAPDGEITYSYYTTFDGFTTEPVNPKCTKRIHYGS